MAKGNLLLGTAKNSVGDVVMYRREGAQITRVRVRNVKNPKTDAQSFQRAIMAPIAKFYSPLSVVLERSFEGLSKAKSHNKFNQVNAGLARANKWALPKGTGFFPLPYQLSQGTIPAITTTVDNALKISIPGLGDSDSTLGKVSIKLINNGYHDGDVVSVIMIAAVISSDGRTSYVPTTRQFVIDETDDTTLEAFLGNGVDGGPVANAIEIANIRGNLIKAGAVIVARFDGTMWRRSTQSLAVEADIITEVTAGTAVAAAIASYGQTAGDGNPLVYLDGDELADGE